MRTASLAGGVVLGLALAVAGVARADESEEARRLFERARESAAAGRMAEARDLFHDSLARLPTIPAAFNLLRTLLETGEYLEAAAVAGELLDGEYGEVTPERRAATLELRTTAERGMGTLSIRVRGREGRLADVYVDGRRVGRAGTEPLVVKVDPGRRVIRAVGSSEATIRVRIERGGEHPLLITLLQPSDEGDGDTAREAPDADGLPLGWLLAGVGVVLAGGAVVGYLLLREPDEFALGEAEALRAAW